MINTILKKSFPKDTNSFNSFIERFPKAYKGFTLLSIQEIKECSSIGIYLRHNKTGLEVFHLYNEDKENLFSYSFRTPPLNNCGTPHILEHSVLCGSAKYPLKEPFTTLMNQSVNSFLNAMTYPDKTVYPAASTIEKDYYNLLDVYGDAVFFPLLKKEAFMQEAYRLVLDSKENPSIQGVVYNEMKAAYSLFDSVSSDKQYKVLLKGTAYEYDSGGDPLAIPMLTYEEYKEYYHKYYKPSNCLLFLYGNIPTTEQLDYLQRSILDRLESRFSITPFFDKAPRVDEEIVKAETVKTQDKIVKIKETAPATGSLGESVTINWLCGKTSNIEEYITLSFLCDVLSCHIASPLSRALTESHLGKDVLPLECHTIARNLILNTGLTGVKSFNSSKVFSTIENLLLSICKEGIEEKEVKAALVNFEITNKERTRTFGPYSIELMEKALNAWNYGEPPYTALLWDSAFKKVSEQALSDKNYIPSLIHKYLLNNSSCVKLVVTPSKHYTSTRLAREKSIIKNLLKNTDRQVLNAEREILDEYQSAYEDDKALSCIPYLTQKDLGQYSAKLNIKTLYIDDKDKKAERILLLQSTEDTGDITYVEYFTPVDTLDARDYKLLPIYTYCALGAGYTGKDWTEVASAVAENTGGLYFKPVTNCTYTSRNNVKKIKEMEDCNAYNRDYLSFSVKLLNRIIDKGLEVLASFIQNYDFTNKKRIKTLLEEYRANLYNSLSENAAGYARTRARAALNHFATVSELWHGVTQLYTINEVLTWEIDKVVESFSRIKKAIAGNGGLLHWTCNKDVSDTVTGKVIEFSKAIGIKPLVKKPIINETLFTNETLIRGREATLPLRETFTLPVQVGYSAACLNTKMSLIEEEAASLVLTHYLSGTLLWERIRTKSGAYGAYTVSLNAINKVCFGTHRDPNVFNSLKIFLEALEELSNEEIDESILNRMIIGTYGDEIAPLSPQDKGKTSLFRTLYGFCDKDIEDKVNAILKVTAQDIKVLAAKLFSNTKDMYSCFICSSVEKGKEAEAGVVIKLPSSK